MDVADRTEEPTPRRLAEARRQGDVGGSRAWLSGLITGGCTAVIALAVPGWVAGLILYMRAAVTRAVNRSSDAAGALTEGIRVVAITASPVCLVALLTAVIAGGLQTRWLFTLQPVRPQLARVAPRWDRLFSRATAFELVRGLVVVAALAWVTLWAGEPLVRDLARVAGAPASAVTAVIGREVRRVVPPLLATTLLAGAADALWQRRRHRRSLRMSREEIRREHKDSEGDPHTKAQRERVRRETLERRALADVRKADFVVVNPDHLAVALRYDRQGDGAPVVVAKGERLMAEQIKAIARQAGVPIFRDVSLARALHDVAEDHEVPEVLWEAVAEIIRTVYQAQGLSIPQERGGPGPGEGTHPDVPAGLLPPTGVSGSLVPAGLVPAGLVPPTPASPGSGLADGTSPSSLPPAGWRRV